MNFLPKRIVGILHTEACLKKLNTESDSVNLVGIDLLEIRLDALPHQTSQLPPPDQDEISGLNRIRTQSASDARKQQQTQREIPWRAWPLPVIATARDPQEGGQNHLSLQERQQLLTAALSWAAILDIELASAKTFAPIIAMAHAQQREVILSYHNFQTTPSLHELDALVHQALQAGATILKVATLTNSEQELERLLAFQECSHPLPIATMGMGALAKISRPQLAAAGSALVYGWLYEPLSMMHPVMQWSARELAERLHILSGT